MQFDQALVTGTLLRRYKRFFVDVRLDDGSEVVAHCPNTGSLLGCLEPGSPVALAPATGKGRKLAWTWKLVHVGRSWVGVDTALGPRLVHEALEAGRLPELSGYERVLYEVPYGVEGRSRIDLLLSRGGEPLAARGRSARDLRAGDERVYVEVKNTTLAQVHAGRSYGAFPDAVTARGLKHLHELMHVVAQGQRAAMVYCVQRSDCEAFAPARDIDPAYAAGLEEAVAAGVEIYALGAELDCQRVHLTQRLPVVLSP